MAVASTAHIAQLGPFPFVMQALYEIELLEHLAGDDAAHGNGMCEQLADSYDDELSFLILDEEMDKEFGGRCEDMLHGGSTAGNFSNEAPDFDAVVARMTTL